MLSDNAGMGGKTLSQTQQINGHKRRFREIAVGAISIPLLPCLVLFPLVAFPFLPLFISPFLTLFLFCLSVSRPPFPVNPTFGSVELIILVMGWDHWCMGSCLCLAVALISGFQTPVGAKLTASPQHVYRHGDAGPHRPNGLID